MGSLNKLSSTQILFLKSLATAFAGTVLIFSIVSFILGSESYALGTAVVASFWTTIIRFSILEAYRLGRSESSSPTGNE